MEPISLSHHFGSALLCPAVGNINPTVLCAVITQQTFCRYIRVCTESRNTWRAPLFLIIPQFMLQSMRDTLIYRGKCEVCSSYWDEEHSSLVHPVTFLSSTEHHLVISNPYEVLLEHKGKSVESFPSCFFSYKKLTVILAVKHLKGQNAPKNESMWLWIDFISSKVIRQLCARNRLKFKSLLVHIFYISLVIGHIQTSLVLAEIQ